MTNEERRPTGLLHTADELRQLIRNSRRCGKDYRIVVLKTVEVKRVIDYDCEEGYAWK